MNDIFFRLETMTPEECRIALAMMAGSAEWMTKQADPATKKAGVAVVGEIAAAIEYVERKRKVKPN